MSIEKLREDLTNAIDNDGLLNMHVSWGPEGEQLSPDERAAIVSDLLVSSKEWSEKPDEEKMRVQIRQAYEYLNGVIGLCQTNFREPFDIKESVKRSEIFGGIEGAMMLLGNWISHDDRMAIRKTRSSETAEPDPDLTNGDR